ncbi:methylated-DNA--[protein]-cysteine S-methyltransferase [Psychromicrobium lacuslunae]|uniref:Cysteine methyltransferase n=1 Tax=Psychromicrobium lacuslunae TaxID=1618207 RepID=A0A0D4BW11_9MICC|nr:methylated-DNA--[protein]-cysteine S-methyltransferase [Psychromicrobium lacuslunae]AJT40632.1 cysteine methyltransferase [Psychromicrobium lacuslunae]
MSNSTAAVASLFTLSTPDGPFTVIARPDAVVLASGWTDQASELTGQIHRDLLPKTIKESTPLKSIEEAVTAFYSGELTAIDQVEVLQHSGPFRTHAWQTLRSIRAGQPVTYSEYANLAGNPRAVRAAASACAFNAAALFVPCHRVLRLDGSLGGFRWGLKIKRSLLDRESPNSLLASNLA